MCIYPAQIYLRFVEISALFTATARFRSSQVGIYIGREDPEDQDASLTEHGWQFELEPSLNELI